MPAGSSAARDRCIRQRRSQPPCHPHNSGKMMQIGPGSGSDATLDAPAEPDMSNPDNSTQRIGLRNAFIATLLRQPRMGLFHHKARNPLNVNHSAHVIGSQPATSGSQKSVAEYDRSRHRTADQITHQVGFPTELKAVRRGPYQNQQPKHHCGRQPPHAAQQIDTQASLVVRMRQADDRCSETHEPRREQKWIGHHLSASADQYECDRCLRYRDGGACCSDQHGISL